MKVSELTKLLKKNSCYLTEHGKEHDELKNISEFRDIKAKRFQTEH